MNGPDLITIVAGALLFALGVACAIFATHREDRMLAIQDTPSLSAHDIAALHRGQGAHGQACELSGVLEADSSLTSPLSGQPCAAYSLTSSWEEWAQPQFGSRKATDISGRVCRDSGTSFDDQRVASFWVRDASGRIQIDPLYAELDMPQTEQRYEVMTASLGNSERRTWHTERALPLGQNVYVLGYLADQAGAPVVRRHSAGRAKRFLISSRSEQQLIGASRLQAYGFYFAAGIAGSLGLVLIAWRVL